MHAMMGTALDRARRPTPRNEGAKVPDAVEKVFEKALAVDPRHRYETIESFWRALEEAVGVPSSFGRSRRRRQDPGYDEELDESSHDDGQAPAPAAEFALEFEDPLNEYVPPSARTGDARQKSSGPSPTSSKSSIDSDEFFLEGMSQSPGVSEAPLPSEPPGAPASFDLDISEGAIGPPPTPSRPRAAVTSGTWQKPAVPDLHASGQFDPPPIRAKSVAVVQAAVEETRSLRSQLKNPLILVGAGLLLTLVDMLLARVMGGTLALGPVRLRWIAAGLAAIGIVLAFWNLLGDRDE
jgi:serine/threonine-protein kinase